MAEQQISEFYETVNRASGITDTQITAWPWALQSVRDDQIVDTQLADFTQQYQNAPRKRTHGTGSGKFSSIKIVYDMSR